MRGMTSATLTLPLRTSMVHLPSPRSAKPLRNFKLNTTSRPAAIWDPSMPRKCAHSPVSPERTWTAKLVSKRTPRRKFTSNVPGSTEETTPLKPWKLKVPWVRPLRCSPMTTLCPYPLEMVCGHRNPGRITQGSTVTFALMWPSKRIPLSRESERDAVWL